MNNNISGMEMKKIFSGEHLHCRCEQVLPVVMMMMKIFISLEINIDLLAFDCQSEEMFSYLHKKNGLFLFIASSNHRSNLEDRFHPPPWVPLIK